MPSGGSAGSRLSFTAGLPASAVAAEPEPVACRREGAAAVTYIVDGKPATCGSVMAIPPDHITSVDVLKGAAAFLYPGSGADGVIVIHTKRDP